LLIEQPRALCRREARRLPVPPGAISGPRFRRPPGGSRRLTAVGQSVRRPRRGRSSG